MHNTTFKINKGGFNRWGMKKMTFFQTTEALPLREKKNKTERGHELLVSRVGCYCQLFSHYKWCCILYSEG